MGILANRPEGGGRSAFPRGKQEAAQDTDEQTADLALVEKFIQGDVQAFKYVYSKYRQRIFSYCLYITGDKTLAEDAFQEAFTRAYTRRDQLKEPKAVKSWLLLITRSVCLNMLRTSKFTPDFVYLDDKDPDEGEGYVHRELTSEALDLAQSDSLRTALQRLSPMYREAFLLREFEGYSYEEISEFTGATVMNVKVRITRAKKQLRTFLEPHYRNSQSKAKGKSGEVSTEDFDDPGRLDRRRSNASRAQGNDRDIPASDISPLPQWT